MKKTLSVILCALLLALCIIPTAFAGTLNEKTAIVIPENASAVEKYAAETLKDRLKELTGVEYPVISDSEEQAEFEILVGNTARTQSNTENLKDGSYFIKSVENGIEIAGAGNRGNIYGVYRFLEEFGGFRCYSEYTGYKSYTGELSIPDDIDISYTPFFEYTDTDWHSPRNDIYSLANGLNGRPYRDLTEEQGGTVEYISSFCHTLASEFCSRDKYFEEHPEYFALSNGTRTSDQLCLTNEEVYNIVLEEVLALIREKHDPDAAVQIVSLTQSDNRNYCTCENCKALDEANGSQSGTIITFVNRIAKAVKEAGYDNIAIDTFAYQYSRKAPTAVVPEDNVIVRLCTIECCFSHPLSDETCEQNIELKTDLENWSKICDRIYVWDYTTNYAYTVGIFPDFGVIQDNMQFFYEHGVKGVYEEGAYYVDGCNTEFAELRSYLLSRLLQNPYCDLEAETEGFLNAFYAEGGEAIGKILKLVTANAEKQHVEIYSSMTESFSFTEDEAKEIDALWEEAKTACTDERALSEINRSEISWRYVKSSLKLCEFSSLISRYNENKKLYQDILDAGTENFNEGFKGMTISPMGEIFGAEDWIAKNVSTTAHYTVTALIYIAVLVFAVMILIKAIKTKKYVFCAYFPLLAAFIELALWHRRAFLAWKDLDQYAISLVIAVIVIMFILITSNSMRFSGRKLKTVLISLAEAFAFACIYEGPILIINNLINKGAANDRALSVSAILCASFLLAVNICTLKLMNKKLNQVKNSEEK